MSIQTNAERKDAFAATNCRPSTPTLDRGTSTRGNRREEPETACRALHRGLIAAVLLAGCMIALATTPMGHAAPSLPLHTGFSVTVRDTTPPSVTVPANIMVEAVASSGSRVSYEATATDIVDGTESVTCDHASGTRFPLGTTTVTCTANDKAGNTGGNSFKVTVIAANYGGYAGPGWGCTNGADDTTIGFTVGRCDPLTGPLPRTITLVIERRGNGMITSSRAASSAGPIAPATFVFGPRITLHGAGGNAFALAGWSCAAACQIDLRRTAHLSAQPTPVTTRLAVMFAKPPVTRRYA
jgi:hypothetical protein